jgi:hypothetical protein
MSSVRMCDKCGNIFSENAEDWSTFTGAVKRKREDGSRYTEQITQDACPSCTAGTPVITPRLAIAPEAAPFPADHPVPPGHADPARIKELEHELGMDEPPAGATILPGSTVG